MLDTLHEDLLRACQQPGCPICRLVQNEVDFYLQSALQGPTYNLAQREELWNSLGLCKEHSSRMLDLGLGNTITAAVGYHDILLTVIQQLQHVDLSPRRPKRLFLSKKRKSKLPLKFEAVVNVFIQHRPCPVCHLAETFSRSALETLLASLRMQEMHGALTSSDGLCLPHLRQLFEQVQDPEMCKELITMNVEQLETLRRKLIELIRQIEQNKDHKITQAEKDTWQIVINVINGER